MIAARLICDLATIAGERFDPPGRIAEALEAGRAAADRAMGPGAADIADRLSLNIGTVSGGLKVNMIPGTCSFEADFRLPVGAGKEDVLARIAPILARHPAATMEELNATEPAACDPFHEMVGILRANARAATGLDPQPILSLGGTDARLWRQRGIPAYVYGPHPTGMGQKDEHVAIDEFLAVVKVHALSAYDYLGGPR
jgi:succinyl-diaminopimelate desuccinylase